MQTFNLLEYRYMQIHYTKSELKDQVFFSKRVNIRCNFLLKQEEF